MDWKQAVRVRRGCVSYVILASAVMVTSLAWALDVPTLTGRVVDLAHVLPASSQESLSARMAAHEAQTGNQAAVLILPSLEGESLEEFSHRVATTWKLGEKGTDNGVLLLVALQERKVRIEVGYGLEGALTDARSAQIIRHDIVPRFRAGDFSGGVSAGVDAILRTIEGTYQASGSREPSQQENDVIGEIAVAVIVGVVVGLSLMGIHRLIGPIAGAGISVLLAPWLVPALMTGGITLVLLLFLSAAGGRGRRYRGVDDGVWYSSRGGGWGSGSFGGVGGGFTGGGGNFGGGGASGNW